MIKALRYFLHLSYNGTQYHGWQKQPDVPSVQETLEKAIQMITKDLNIHCMGCGRTDKGVHADSYYAHLDTEASLSEDDLYRINRVLPGDILVKSIHLVGNEANAQLDAIQRTYQYHMHFNKNPFINELSALYHDHWPDIDKMKDVVKQFTQTKDFHIFCLRPNQYKSTLVDIEKFEVLTDDETREITFIISANRFLQGMVRILVGRIMQVGKGQLTIEDIKQAIGAKQPLPFNRMAHPQGLSLIDVSYPPELSQLL